MTKQEYVTYAIARDISEGWSEEEARNNVYNEVGEVTEKNANLPVDLAESPNLESYLEGSPVLKWLHDNGLPLNRAHYISMAGFGQEEDYDWNEEDEAGVPKPLQDYEAMERERGSVSDKPFKLYEVWNTETRTLGALISASSLKAAIKEARKHTRRYDNLLYSATKMKVCVAVPENITSVARASVTQYGYWFA